MENENENLIVPPESEREKTEDGQTISAENEIVCVENAETSGTAAQIAATDNAMDLPKKKGQRDMTEGVIWKQILAFALPILLSNVIQRLYNAVDSIVVGRFVGHEALAAVGSNNSIINVFVSLFLGISVGAGVVVAQYYGAKDDEKLKKSVQTCAFLAIVSGIVLTIGGYFLAEPILKLVHTPENVMALSREYLQIYFLGVLGALIYNMGSGVILAVGDSKRPFLYLLFACCLNIALDVVFVKNLRMGVAGAAWATLISQYVSAILVTLRLLLTKQNYKLSFRHFKIDKPILKNIFKVGLPAGLQSSMYSVGNLLIQSSLNTFGSVVMAGWVAAMKVDDFTYAPICSYGMAMNSFVGQNAGAKRMDRVKKGFYTALIMSVVTAVVIIVPVLILRGDVVRIFNKEADVVNVGSDIILHICPFYVIFGMCEVFSGTLKGLSKSLTAFIITFVGILLTRIIWLYTAVLMTHNLTVLFMIYPISWVVTAAIYFIYLAVKKWDGMLDMTAEDRFIEKLRHIGKKKTA